MKANEIRIGNWYQEDWITGEFNQITVKDIEFLVDDPLDDHYMSIEITEEWLLKLGFIYSEYFKNYKVKAGDYFNSVKWDDEENEWSYNNDSSDAGCYYVTSIRYVHQLQNLFFALTGQELTIKQ